MDYKPRSELEIMSSDAIDRYKTELEQNLKQMIVEHGIVERQKLEIQRKIIDLQSQKKDLELSLSKSSENKRVLQIEIALAKSMFWAVKNEGG